MTCSVFTAHLDLEGDTLIGALFLTYRLDLSAFEELILPKLLPVRHPPGEKLFSEEARRRLAETPVAVVADASCLDQAGAAGGASVGTCSVPIVRFTQPGGAFHPKLALLACKSRGVRVVIGSANLTEAGITRQIELVSSFWLDDHRSAVPGLRATLRALEKRLGKSPSYLRAASVVERAFPKASSEDTSPLVLCSSTPILDRALQAIATDTGGHGRVEEVSIVSPFFERGGEDRSLFDQIDERIQKHLPRSKDPRYVLRLPTRSSSAPYHVEAPVERFRDFAQKASFECLVLTPERRTWADDPKSDDVDDRKPRDLHGKLVVFRVKHGSDSWVYTLLGSPNFTKAALLGGNFEIALLQRAGKAPSGIELPVEKVSVTDLVEDLREFKSPSRETNCIDRVVMRVRDKVLEVIATEGLSIPASLALRAGGQLLAWQPVGANAIVHPFEDSSCTFVEVRLNEHWYSLPIEVEDPEEAVSGDEAVELSLEQLLARSAAYGGDPDGMGLGGGRSGRGPGTVGDKDRLTSMADVAPQLESICELAIALETSLAEAPTPEALLARFHAYFAPTLRALVTRATPSQLRTHAFALLDVQRAADRLRRQFPATEKVLRSAAEQISAKCAELVARLERSAEPPERASITALRRRFEAG